jgi:hypothetical protein
LKSWLIHHGFAARILIPASGPRRIDRLNVGGINLCGLNARAGGPGLLLPQSVAISVRRLPTEAALLGLADIYRELATEPRDRLRIAAIAILVVTGLRIGELLTMPADCEVEEVRGGKPRYGLRYFREKSRGGAKVFAVRWLTATGAELARQHRGDSCLTHRAVGAPRNLSGPYIEADSTSPAARMNAAEVSNVVGLQSTETDSATIPMETVTPSWRSRYLLSLRVALCGLSISGRQLPDASEISLVTFRHFFIRTMEIVRSRSSQSQSYISDFLSAEGDSPAFERFDIQPGGSFCWGQPPVPSLAELHRRQGRTAGGRRLGWLGRENPRDTEAYRHATVTSGRWVKEGIRNGRAARKRMLNCPVKTPTCSGSGDQGCSLNSFGQLHDFAVTLQYHLNCVRGRPDYLRTKGQRARSLVQIQLATERLRREGSR